jgi:hypothetical protein
MYSGTGLMDHPTGSEKPALVDGEDSVTRPAATPRRPTSARCSPTVQVRNLRETARKAKEEQAREQAAAEQRSRAEEEQWGLRTPRPQGEVQHWP